MVSMAVQETSSEEVTDGIRVSVRAQYSAEHSDPLHNQWFFLYTIRITNESQSACQLISRHWIIRDATGRMEEVRGPGVVGEQPELAPGESFEYTSGCPLPTPLGSMEGLYEMRRVDGNSFEARIARFELREASAIH